MLWYIFSVYTLLHAVGVVMNSLSHINNILYFAGVPTRLAVPCYIPRLVKSFSANYGVAHGAAAAAGIIGTSGFSLL